MATKTKAEKSEKQIAMAMAKELEQTQREIAVFLTMAQTVPVWALPHAVHVQSGVCGVENEIILALQAKHAVAPKTAPEGPGRAAIWKTAQTANQIHAWIKSKEAKENDGKTSKRYPLKTVKQYLSHTMRQAGYVASMEWKTPEEKASLKHSTNTPAKWFLVSNSKQAKQGHK